MVHRALTLVSLLSLAVAGLTAASQDQRVTFRSSLDLVSIAVVVRDGGGRLVSNLNANDFEIVEGNTRRSIEHFQAGRDGDARLALLVDSSGSMVVGARPERARLAADMLLAGMRPADTASVFSFDSEVRRLTPYTSDTGLLRNAVSKVVPYGTTCLFDAIADTAQAVQADTPRARAVVLLTDGIDTASASTGEDAAATATRFDLPVYVIGVGSLSDPPEMHQSRRPTQAPFSLSELARRTGGFSADATSPAQLSIATRTILDELHQQYLLAFQGGTQPGWHQLQVKVRRGRVNARSRDGYFVH